MAAKHTLLQYGGWLSGGNYTMNIPSHSSGFENNMANMSLPTQSLLDVHLSTFGSIPNYVLFPNTYAEFSSPLQTGGQQKRKDKITGKKKEDRTRQRKPKLPSKASKDTA